MEEEDYWEKFDPWLKKKAPDIYKKMMNGFYDEFNERMSTTLWSDKEWELENKYVSLVRDFNGVYMDNSNEVVINQIFPPAK